MKKFVDLDFKEQKEVAALFANWLSYYTHEVIVKVLAKRDEILENDFAMGLIKELKIRSDKERKEFELSIEFMMKDFDGFSKYDPHNHALEHSKSYRDVLYDMYIKD
jgi:hypothetical protein